MAGIMSSPLHRNPDIQEGKWGNEQVRATGLLPEERVLFELGSFDAAAIHSVEEALAQNGRFLSEFQDGLLSLKSVEQIGLQIRDSGEWTACGKGENAILFLVQVPKDKHCHTNGTAVRPAALRPASR